MPNVRRIAAAILLITQAAWWPMPAQAQSSAVTQSDKSTPHSPSQRHRQQHPSTHPHPQMHSPSQRHVPQPLHKGQPPMQRERLAHGGFFSDQQRDAARIYYAQPEQRGYCPPGLRKKSHDCLPPGQARAWQRGQPLPSSVVYYSLPRSMEITLGPPPTGHRYVRVASDILLLAIGTGLVVDAMEDIVR